MGFAGVLRQSTAVTVKIGPFVDSTDGNTEETALTLSQADIRLSKNGGNIAQKNESTSASHDELGLYDCALDATDTNTCGTLMLAVHESGALLVRHDFQVVEEAVYDAIWASSAALAVGSVTGNVGGNVTGSVGSLAAQAKSDVNAEVLDVLNVDTFAQPGQGTPPATTTIRLMLAYIFKGWRNRSDTTDSQYSLYNDDASTVDQKATVSDDGTTLSRGEVATGP